MAKATFQAANFFGDECHGKVVESTGLKHIQGGFDGFCVLSSRLNLPHLLGQWARIQAIHPRASGGESGLPSSEGLVAYPMICRFSLGIHTSLVHDFPARLV